MRYSSGFILTAIMAIVLVSPSPTSSSIVSTRPIITANISAPTINNTKDSSIEQCIDLVDFFYEIVLALSSYPPSTCSPKEEREISTFLQSRLNYILKNTPGTINTRNKLCPHAINNRRFLKQQSKWPSFEPFNSWFSSSSLHRMLIHNFVYIGGGRCRFCFYDNYDNRRRLVNNKHNLIKKNNAHEMIEIQTTRTTTSATTTRPGGIKRDLLEFMDYERNDDDLPKVSDPLLCPSHVFSISNVRDDNWIFEGWTNKKIKTIKGASKSYELDRILGPYGAGESFGRTFSLRRKDLKTHGFNNRKKMVPRPVKQVTLNFRLWAFDIPREYTHEILGDEPFILFINGIKLDFNVLLKAPGVDSYVDDGERLVEADSFAGINWYISESNVRAKNLVLGPKKDREYYFTLNIPAILFENAVQRELHVEFLIKPTAKAKSYGIDQIALSASVALCEIIGLERSPFDEFKAVMERRLEDKLWGELAQEFQNKKGHCLKDKVPMVNFHLVQKEKWKNANPRC